MQRVSLLLCERRDEHGQNEPFSKLHHLDFITDEEHQPFFRFVLLFVAALWNKQRADEKQCSDKEATFFFFFLAACYFFKLRTLDTETTLKSIYPNCCYFEICNNFVEMLIQTALLFIPGLQVLAQH